MHSTEPGEEASHFRQIGAICQMCMCLEEGDYLLISSQVAWSEPAKERSMAKTNLVSAPLKKWDNESQD